MDVVWHYAPAHRGETVREYLRRPGLGVRLVNLPASSRTSMPMRADGAVWGGVREEVNGNLCLGTESLVQQKVSHFLIGHADRTDEVKRRSQIVLQPSRPDSQRPANLHPILALVLVKAIRRKICSSFRPGRQN